LTYVVVGQEYDDVVVLTVVLDTCVPSILRRYVYGAVPPVALRPTLTAPLTVAPAAGLVNEAAGGLIVFCTVTGRVNWPALLVASRTWATIVRGPFAVFVVSQGTVT